MTTSMLDVKQVADELHDAEATRIPIESITGRFGTVSPEQAYEIQRATMRRRLDAGAVVRGHKVGLTARRMQELFGIDEPDYGHLLSDMFLYERTEVDLDRFISPRIEIEPAFVLDRPLRGPGLTAADVMLASAFVVPCFEIIDSRIRDWDIRLADTIADNGSSKAVVLGGRPVRLTDVDVRDLGSRLIVADDVVETGSTAEILGSPVSAVAWLANKLGEHGGGLDAGHVVLPGTCIRAVAIDRPCTVRGEFDILGTVEISFR